MHVFWASAYEAWTDALKIGHFACLTSLYETTYQIYACWNSFDLIKKTEEKKKTVDWLCWGRRRCGWGRSTAFRLLSPGETGDPGKASTGSGRPSLTTSGPSETWFTRHKVTQCWQSLDLHTLLDLYTGATHSGRSLMVPSLANRRKRRPFCTSCKKNPPKNENLDLY